MWRSLDCIVLPFSEAGARSIKLRHFSPLKEKDYFRRQKLIGFALPPLSDWCFCHRSHLSLYRPTGLSHTESRHLPVPPSWTKTTMLTRLDSPLGLQSLHQEYAIQLVKKRVLSDGWVPAGSVMLFPKARNRVALQVEWHSAKHCRGVVLGGHRPLSPTLLPSFFSSSGQCRCPTRVWPNLPVPGSIATGTDVSTDSYDACE